jgi:hypothetical protein
MVRSKVQNSMLLVLSLNPAPFHVFLCQRWPKEALYNMLLKPHAMRSAAGSMVSLRSYRPREEVRSATALGPTTRSSTLGNSVRDRRPAVSMDRPAVLLDIRRVLVPSCCSWDGGERTGMLGCLYEESRTTRACRQDQTHMSASTSLHCFVSSRPLGL